MLFIAFTNWNRREYTQFIRMNEKYGLEDMDSISKSIDGKTPKEVIDYSKVFWERYNELPDAERIKRIQDRTKRRQMLKEIFNAKVCNLHVIIGIFFLWKIFHKIYQHFPLS